MGALFHLSMYMCLSLLVDLFLSMCLCVEDVPASCIIWNIRRFE